MRNWGDERLVVNTRDLTKFADGYVREGIDRRRPDVSPIYADLKGCRRPCSPSAPPIRSSTTRCTCRPAGRRPAMAATPRSIRRMPRLRPLPERDERARPRADRPLPDGPGLSDAQEILPPAFRAWFAARGWTPRSHQLDLLRIARAGRSALLVAPTGAGKTLAGFLPSLVALSERAAAKAEPKAPRGLHTLYVSPLKALAVDIARNLDTPIAEMALPVRVETRTGDTPAHKRTRQISRPPDILLTTPEQLALLIAHRDAAAFFSGLRCVILDELHALVTSKRGDLLALALARLHRLSPDLASIGCPRRSVSRTSCASIWCRSAQIRRPPWPTSSPSGAAPRPTCACWISGGRCRSRVTRPGTRCRRSTT